MLKKHLLYSFSCWHVNECQLTEAGQRGLKNIGMTYCSTLSFLFLSRQCLGEHQPKHKIGVLQTPTSVWFLEVLDKNLLWLIGRRTGTLLCNYFCLSPHCKTDLTLLIRGFVSQRLTPEGRGYVRNPALYMYVPCLQDWGCFTLSIKKWKRLLPFPEDSERSQSPLLGKDEYHYHRKLGLCWPRCGKRRSRLCFLSVP